MGHIPSQIIAEFYEASLEPARWPQALLALGEWAKADAVAFLTHDYEDGTGRFERAIGISSDAQSNYRRLYARSNVWLLAEDHFRKAPAVIRGSDIVADDQLKSSHFHRNWLKATGLAHHLFALVDRQGSRLSSIVLARRDGKADFDEDVVNGLRAIVPILARALSAGTVVDDLRALERAALKAIDTLAIGVAFIDRDGAIVEANRFAKAVLDAGEGLSYANGGLAIDAGGRRLKLRDLLVRFNERGSLVSSEDVSILPVPRSSGQRPLTLLLLPVDGGAREKEHGPAGLLFIGDPERPVTFDQARIARLYGLSRAESRVAALLASGYRLEQVAEALDIAYETVRKHLKQIFGKTGTYRQAELVRMLVTGPANLSI